MALIRALLLQKHWLNRDWTFSVLRDFFGSLGLIWLLIEVATFFGGPELVHNLKSHLAAYFWISVLYAIWKNLPRRSYTYKIADRDCHIELRIGDILGCRGDLVVPCNDCFDASLGGKAAVAPTVQGAVIRRLFRKDAARLQSALDNSMMQRGMCSDRYPLGTVVPVKTDRGTLHLFASSVLTESNRAKGDAGDIVRALPSLWGHICKEADKCRLCVPLIGTGNARTAVAREEMFVQIVNTFMDSCADSTYCNRLTVVIHPDDVVSHQIDVQRLCRFLRARTDFPRYFSSS